VRRPAKARRLIARLADRQTKAWDELFRMPAGLFPRDAGFWDARATISAGRSDRIWRRHISKAEGATR